MLCLGGTVEIKEKTSSGSDEEDTRKEIQYYGSGSKFPVLHHYGQCSAK
ncbi:MAG: hypothetical protein Q8O43_09065 [Dehalococcoidia bacterium]|nr:hypothetical protein [Dehalococcoidia bacterium]